MKSAKDFWSSLVSSEKLGDWQSWSNVIGADGQTVVDDTDTVSFINKSLKRAVKIIHNVDDSHAYAVWVDKFSDNTAYPEDTIEELVVTYRNFSEALKIAKPLFQDWQTKDFSYVKMQEKLSDL